MATEWKKGLRLIWLLGLAFGPAFTFAAGSETQPPAIKSQPLHRTPSGHPGTTLFVELPPDRTGVQFQLQLRDMARYIHEMIHLSVYGGICTGDFDNDGLTDFYVTSPLGGNRLYRNLGDFRFEDVTESEGLLDTNFWGTGATFVDINNDGLLDIYACGYRQPNRLYINQGKGPDGRVHFVEKAHEYGLDFNGASMTMAFGDFDRDGDLDAYLATTAIPPPAGVKFGVVYEGSKPVVPKQLQEYWGLLYPAGQRPVPTEAGQFDHFYRNDGGKFTEITSQAGIDGAFFTLSALWWDSDGDGWPDLYVSNDYLGPDKLYRNNGDGTFTDVIRQVIPHTPWSSMGTDIGDFNNDGLIDLMATDMVGSTHFRRNVMMGEATKREWFLEYAEPRQYIRNALYLNTGAGRMMEFAYQAGLPNTDWTWGPRIEDFDNDGRQDIFIANGMLRDVQNGDLGTYADRTYRGGSQQWAEFWATQALQKETNMVFRNLGGMRFEHAEIPWGLNRLGVSFGCATADFDNDGRLDLVVNNGDAPLSIYRNVGATGHSIRMRLKGTLSNRFGIGATVRLQAGGSAQVRYLTLARAWLSASEPILHFGLGVATRIDSLTIDWPCSPRQSFTNLEADRFYTISEPTNSGRVLVAPSKPGKLGTPLFRATNLLDNISIVEPAFEDPAREPLLPWRLSQRAGCMAWGDVNGDGKTDLFIGAMPGQPARLFIRNAAGHFEASAQPAFEVDTDCEDAAAVFFDANHNGQQDLLVVGGGVRHDPGDLSYRHRLYINDGKGHFSPAPKDALPAVTDGASCVVVADFDGDGLPDVLLGGRSVPGRYPLFSETHLWLNRGRKFVEATPAALRRPGIVTAALACDVDGDGKLDLVLTTFWGPVRYFHNEAAGLTERTTEVGLAERTGWWNAIAAGDIDSDGRPDFVVGNQGLNSVYHATPAAPELLFYGDLDGSGTSNLAGAYFVGEYGFPHDGLDKLSKAMPSLRARFPTYAKYAQAPIDDLFGMDRLRRSIRREANTLESGVFLNKKEGFRFESLPPLAQIAPARDLALIDVDGDGRLDLVIGQNDFSLEPLVGRMDGGTSLVLLGKGQGRFEPLMPEASGVLVPEEVRRLAVTDLDGDGRADLVFRVSPGTFRCFVRLPSSP
jgi:hypothetical protein